MQNKLGVVGGSIIYQREFSKLHTVTLLKELIFLKPKVRKLDLRVKVHVLHKIQHF